MTKAIDLDRVSIQADAKADRLPDGLALATPPGQWYYAASLAFAPGDRPAGDAAAIEIDVTVEEGALGIGLVDASLSNYVSGEEVVRPGDPPTTLILPDDGLDPAEGQFTLIFRNCGPDGAARARIHGVRVTPRSTLSRAELKRRLANRHGYWHYAFDLGDGVRTETRYPTQMDFHRISNSILAGLIDDYFATAPIRRVLDAGCSSGFHTIQLARRGWDVLGIDFDPRQIDQARFVKDCIASDLALRYEQADIRAFQAEPFDFVHCSGLLYHLEDVVGGARRLFELTTHGAVIHSHVTGYDGETLTYGDYRLYPFCGDYEFAFVPTLPLIERILRHVGFRAVHAFRALDRIPESRLANLSPSYADILRHQTAYFAALR